MAYAAGGTPSEGRSAPTSVAVTRPESTWLERAVAAVDRSWRWALAVLMIADAGLLLYMGRGLTFFYDDWNFVTQDYGGGIHSLLLAHVGNISIFPIAVYKVLFHLVGLNHYAVFRLVVIVLHLICGGLVFLLASRRIPRVPALLAAALILFLGAAWEDLLWAFQTGYLLSVAGGLATWALLERKGRPAEVAAMLCLVVSAGSSSLGIAVMVGVAVELAWERRWRAGWIVVVPALLYALWYLGYGESQVTANSLTNAPGFAADLAAAAFGGLVGRALEWGRPLAVLGLLVLLRRLARPFPVSARLAGLIATGVSLWVVTAAARSTISTPETSRYIYLGAVVIVLIGVELLREVTITPRVIGLATALVVISVVTGLTVMHAGALERRENAETVRADLGALELAAAYAPPGYQPDPQGAPQILAGPYLHTVRSIGSTPADTSAELISSEAGARAAADGVLLALEAPRLVPFGNTHASLSALAPTVSALSSGAQVHQGGCVDLTPLPGATMSGVLLLPSGGVAIRDRGNGAAALALRRFGETFDAVSSAVAPRSGVALLISRDASTTPWQLQVSASSTILVCGRSS